MATQRSEFTVPLAEFAAALLARPDVSSRAQVAAEQAAQLLPGTAVVVYIIEDVDDPAWTRKAIAGEVEVSGTLEFSAGTLGAVAKNKTLMVFDGADLQREDYAHLDTRRTVTALAYVPLLADEVLFGAIELISYEQPFPEAMLEALHQVAELASPAIAAARSYESERNASLQSISRVTQMYDLEKVFNSTLEMDELLEIIAKKFQEVMGVQGVNLWMVKDDTLELVSSAGFDPTVQLGMVQRPGEGVAGDISDNGEPVLIDDPADERLQKRNTGHEDGAVFSIVAGPLMEHESLVGVVEAVNRLDGAPFDEDDQFLLTNICETASNALHNASLLQSERKVEILQTLVQVSREITSTLDLERVLRTVVDTPGAVIPYNRAAIALEQRGKLQLRAVSGMTQINPGDPEVTRLKEVLQWAALSKDEVYIRKRGEEIDTEDEEVRLKFQRYFAESGMCGFYAVPLADDEGEVGVLSFESSEPDFLTGVHIEMIKVLAGQATVALRNASLYREVPFITLLEPILQKKQKFLALEKSRRILFIAVAAGVAALLVLFPLPMRVDGNATVAASRTAQIQPEVGGVVRQVYVHEGQHVERGQILADLEDWEYRAALAGARAKFEAANSEMNRALAGNDSTEAGIQRVQAAYWASEVERSQERLDKTHLRAPLDGWVTTPHVEDFTGRHLAPGDTFGQIVNSSQAMVEVAVDERDVALLGAGMEAAVKLDSFPLRTLKGRVAVVSPKSDVQDEQRVFYARVSLPNPDGSIRPGMQGRGKVSVGWHPVGYVIFRRPGMWFYTKLWSWMGW